MTTLPSFVQSSLEPVANMQRWQATLSWEEASVVAQGGDVLDQPRVDHRAAWDWQAGPASTYSGHGSLRLIAGCAAAVWFLDRARRLPEFRPAVVLDLVLEEEPFSTRTVMRARVAAWRVDGLGIELTLEAAWPWNREALLCRDLALLATGMAAGLDGPVWIPQVFGEVDGVPMARLVAGQPVGVRTIVRRADTTITLERLPAGWPTSGTVQVGDELMTYGAIVDGPPRLTGLTRPNPRDHGATSRAMWLPAEGARWLAADHEATVLAVAPAAAPDEPVASFTTSTVMIDGRSATRVELATWPIRVVEGASVSVVEEASDAAHWQLDASTSTINPTRAFGEPDAADGTVFERAQLFWKALAKRPVGAGVDRFASIERARVRFDISFASSWTASETLTVRARRGAAVVEKALLRPVGVGVTLVADVAVDAAALGAIEVATPPELVRFESVTPTGDSPWTDPDNAINGGMASVAVLEQAAGLTAPLGLNAGALPTGDDRRVERLVLLVYARVVGGSPLFVATITTGSFTVANTASGGGTFAWIAIPLVLPAGDHALADLLGAGASLTLDTDSESTVEVADIVLQVVYQAQAIDVPGAAATLGVSAPQATPFAAYEIDVTSLLEDARDWAAMDGDITIEFQLVSLVTGERAEMRHLHWVIDRRPASSVRLETDLVATVRGRLTALDGRCNPVAVLGAMWGEEDLLALPPADLDAAAEARAAQIATIAERRFRAAFAQRITQDAAMRQAIAEAGLMLVPGPTGWAWRAPDQLVVDAVDGLLGPQSVIDVEVPRRVEAATLAARRLVGRRRDVGAIGDVVRRSGVGEQVTTLTWLDDGFDSLAWLAFDHAGRSRDRVVMRARPAWLWTPLGARLALALPDQHLANVEMVVERVAFDGAATWLEGRLGGAYTAQIDGALEVRREYPGPRLGLWVNGRKWAEFDPAGDLRIPGMVSTGQTLEARPAGISYVSDGDPLLVFGTGGPGTMVIDEEGNLAVVGTVTTNVALVGTPPTHGWSATAGGLAIGTPELGLVAFLDEATGDLSLAGRVRGLA